VVSTRAPYDWTQTEWTLGQGYGTRGAALPGGGYDFGVKRNILRMLAERGCQITVVPAQTPAAEVLAMQPDGVFLSNGPGDPEPCDYAIAATRSMIDSGMPTFGICLGHQIMALAVGAKTFKMANGHHGANHPVRTWPAAASASPARTTASRWTQPAGNVRATHISLFDGTLQGFEFKDQPAFCFQGHPEASPGPQDIGYLFDRFITLMEQARKRHLTATP
jgi:carbamoyl-phosphate synthase small subunit